MNVEVRLTKFKGKERGSGFFTITDKGNFEINWTFTKLGYLIKYLFLKKKAISLQKTYSNERRGDRPTIIQFCKKYPTLHWGSESKQSIDDNTCFTVCSTYPILLKEFHKKVCNIANVEYDSVKEGNLEEYSKLLDKTILNNKLSAANIFLGNNAVILTNGKYLITSTVDNVAIKFIVTPETIEHFRFMTNIDLKKSINVLWENTPEFMYGTFKKSIKGTPLFYPCDKAKAEHILIRMRTDKDLHNYSEPIPYPLYKEYVKPNYFAIIPNGTIVEYDEENI